MKVVYFSTASTYSGGAIISLLNIVPILQEHGIEPYFILKKNGNLSEVLRERHIPYYVIRSYDWCIPEENTYGLINRIKWFIKSLFNIFAEIRTALLLRRIKADVYHINCIYNGTGVYAATMLKIPIVWHLREFVDLYGDTNVFVTSSKAWKLINKSDLIICVSKYLKDFYKDKIKEKDKLKVIYDGIPTEKFNKKYRNFNYVNKERIINIGIAGTSVVKNHRDIILALGKIKEKGYYNFTLSIAGAWYMDQYNQRYRSNLCKLIESNGLEENVIFAGMQKDMNEFWNRCDISVVCSIRESFGLAAVEALACGVPLICSDTSITDEITNFGKNAYIYETGNIKELEEKLIRCIRALGTDEQKSMSDKAEQYVKERFSIENSAFDVLELYKLL